MTETPEIERRFLLKSFPEGAIRPSFLDKVKAKKILIEQFYTPDGRLRVEHGSTLVKGPRLIGNGERSYVRNTKTPIPGSKFGKNEKEWELTPEEFLTRLATATKKIVKHRAFFHDGEVKWDLDHIQFSSKLGHVGSGHLFIAEAEMPSEDYPLEIPEAISERIIMEITGIKAFDNYSLADNVMDPDGLAKKFAQSLDKDQFEWF